MHMRSVATAIGISLLCTALFGAQSGTSLAGENANAKVLLHLASPTSKNTCSRLEAMPECAAVSTSGDLYPASYFSYVLIANASPLTGVAGVQFAISYDGELQAGVDISQWVLCASMEFPIQNWPASGTGNLLTWNITNACQRVQPHGESEGVLAVAGYFYCTAYSTDVLSITTHPGNGLVNVVGCDVQEDTLAGANLGTSALGSISFSAGGSDSGYNPCGQQLRDEPQPGVLPSASGAALPFDPEIHTGPIPSHVLIGRNRVLVLDNEIFLEGDRLTLVIGDEREVIINSTPIRRAASQIPSAKPATELDIWLDTFFAVFALANGSDEERMIQAINAAGSWFVSDSIPPEIESGRVILYTATGLQYRLDTNHATKVIHDSSDYDPSVDLRIISKLLSEDESGSWLVLRISPSSVSIYSGSEGEMAMRVIRAQCENRLSGQDRELASRLGIGASLLDRLVRGVVK